MTAFDRAWELIKAPFDIHHPNDGKIKTIDRNPLYSGGDRIHDDFKYWTEDAEEALAYALYGSAVPGENDEWDENIPMRETYPAIKVMENPPDEYISLRQDPQSQGYIDEDGEMGGEFMDEDDLYAWIASMLPDYEMTPQEGVKAWKNNRMVKPINSLGTTGWFHGSEARDEHMGGALNRLRDQMSGRVALPDEVMGRVSTAHTDYLLSLDGDMLFDAWRYMEDWEKEFIRRARPEDADALDADPKANW